MESVESRRSIVLAFAAFVVLAVLIISFVTPERAVNPPRDEVPGLTAAAEKEAKKPAQDMHALEGISKHLAAKTGEPEAQK